MGLHMNSGWIVIFIILILWIFFHIRSRIRQKKYESHIHEYFENIKQQEIEKLDMELSDLIKKYKTNQIILRDKKGNVINICPKCYATYVPVRSKRSEGKFLGCSNYPRCQSYGDMNKLKNLDIKWEI